MKKILDLGCGRNKYKTNEAAIVVGLDKYPFEGVDIVHDLEKTPLPFNDNEFDEIIASHILEHIQNFIPLMEELHRILKPSGILHIYVPHASDLGAFGHIDHKRFFTIRTFSHFTENNPENQYSKARFKILKVKLNFIARTSTSNKFLNFVFNPILNFNHRFYEKFLFKLIPAGEIYVQMQPIK
ncbi:MAG: class I SAM-dependent methyltransferase [Candidatus Aenigmatarchaeota archaeon]